MKGDFTRDTFDKTKHFSRVLMQQGRVQLDADWNEQAAIMLHYLRALAADVIGPHGGPSNGFLIETSLANVPPLSRDFAIHDGHYYVDGILCELEGTSIPITVPPDITPSQVQVPIGVLDNLVFQELQYVELFDAAQPAVPPTPFQITSVDKTGRLLTLNPTPTGIETASAPMLRRIATYRFQPTYRVPMLLSNGQPYLVYLDVWERHITHLEDDGDISIREVALRGPDTATRTKVVWQVRVHSSANPQCTDVNTMPMLSQARLRARASQVQPQTDPCLIQPEARYRGAENQLYRVEIHRRGIAWDGKPSGTPQTSATFKWSRENGCVVVPVLKITPNISENTTTVGLAYLGRDDKLRLTVGDWVEIVDDEYVLQNRAERLLQVHSIDRDQITVTLEGVPDSDVGSDQNKHPLLRRWDYQEKKGDDPKQSGLPFTLSNDKAVMIVEESGEDTDKWFVLEDGVQIQFQPGGDYRTGDYWLIPARTETGDVEWPKEKDMDGNVIASAMPPHGVEHHYAPLAVINVSDTGEVSITQSCRLTIGQIGKA